MSYIQLMVAIDIDISIELCNKNKGPSVLSPPMSRNFTADMVVYIQLSFKIVLVPYLLTMVS